jgi:hypothetical protein
MKKKTPSKKRSPHQAQKPLSKKAITKLSAYKIVGLFKSGDGTLAEQHDSILYGLKD